MISTNSTRRANMRSVSESIRQTLQLHGVEEGEVSVLLTDDATVAALNEQFRGVPGTTDVLTFLNPKFPGAPLGEIVISVDQAQRQAVANQLTLQQELQILGIHGALHILGFDDESTEDRNQMMLEMKRAAEHCAVPWNDLWGTRLGEADSA